MPIDDRLDWENVAHIHHGTLCATLMITEIKKKHTMKHHLRAVRMASFRKSKDSRCWQGYREMEMVIHCQWEVN